MAVRLDTDGWSLLAAGVTVLYAAAMRWCMPTPTARLRAFAAPLVGYWMIGSGTACTALGAYLWPHLGAA